MTHTRTLNTVIVLLLSGIIYASGVATMCELPSTINEPLFNICNPFDADYTRVNATCLPPNLILTCVFTNNNTLSADDLALARNVTNYASMRAVESRLQGCTQDGQQVPLFGCASGLFCQELAHLNTLGLLQNWGSGCCLDDNCNTGYQSTYLTPFVIGAAGGSNTNIIGTGTNTTAAGSGTNSTAAGTGATGAIAAVGASNFGNINSNLQCYQSQNGQIPTSPSGCANNSLCIQIPANSPCSLLQFGDAGLPSGLNGNVYYGCVPISTCLDFSQRASEIACAAIFDLCCGSNGCNRPQELPNPPLITTTRISSAVGLIASFSLLLIPLALI